MIGSGILVCTEECINEYVGGEGEKENTLHMLSVDGNQ